MEEMLLSEMFLFNTDSNPSKPASLPMKKMSSKGWVYKVPVDKIIRRGVKKGPPKNCGIFTH